jgi:hypothetical protein
MHVEEALCGHLKQSYEVQLCSLLFYRSVGMRVLIATSIPMYTTQ